MGNSYQRDKDLRIHIETQKHFYNSGSTIQGVIFVQAFRNFTFDALYIRIQGDESCQWFQGSSRNRRKFTGNQNFYTVQHVIQKFKSKYLEKGSYAYPFTFQLSENLPGSYIPKGYDARIQYKMSAYFVDYSNKQTLQIQQIPIFIRQPFRQQMAPYQGTVERSPKACFCFDQGSVQLNAWFQRNVAYQSQSVRIQVIADNKLGKKILNTFLIELVQYIFVCANNGIFRTYTKVIKSDKVNHSIKVGQKKTFSYDFLLPQIEHQTTISTLVANYYQIEVSTRTNIIVSEQPCIYAPIFILKKDFKNYIETKEQDKLNIAEFKMSKPRFFSSPQHWFKKNKNLSVMNFKLQQHMGSIQDNI